jgi:hypothetical protein
MALSNKDLKAMMEARKAARRAIPQDDPAEVVAQSEPEAAPPGQPTQGTDNPPPDVAVPQPVIEEPPELEVAEPAPTTPTLPPAAGLEVEDARTQAPPPDDLYIPKTLKVKRHRADQLRTEAYHRAILMQDIVETALDEYFKKRYGRQGRGQRQ